MFRLRVLRDIGVEDPFFGRFTLQGGVEYLVHDPLAITALTEGWGEVVDGAGEVRILAGEDLRPHDKPLRVLAIFPGFLGDALAVAVLFEQLRREYNFSLTVACRDRVLQAALRPMGFRGPGTTFPIPFAALAEFDCLHPDPTRFIPEERRSKVWDQPLLRLLLESHGLPLPARWARYRVPLEACRRFALPPPERPRVGVSVESRGFTRRYPDETAVSLVGRLLDGGLEVHLFHAQASAAYEPFRGHPGFRDHSGVDVDGLAALMRQMQLVVAVDSFPAHLAGRLGIPALVLLSTTGPGLFRLQPGALCLASPLKCAPCGEIMGPCPLGHPACQAFLDAGLTPADIAAAALKHLRGQRSVLPPS